jgi:hypothetical protein
LVLAALALSSCGLTISAEARARRCTSAECACEKALESNTVEALEKFLKDYQDDASIGNSACAALSVPDEEEEVASRKAEFDSSPTQPDLPAE